MNFMSTFNLSPLGHRTITQGQLDYVQNGTLYVNTAARSVLVTSAEDLPLLPDATPGTIAYTAGFKAMWQLSADGEWVPVFDFSGSDSADGNASDDQTEGG